MVRRAPPAARQCVKYSCSSLLTISELSPKVERDIEEESVAGTLKCRGRAGRVITKIREVARLFPKSPMLSDELTAFARRAKLNSKLELVMDVRARWNSSPRMIGNSILLRPALQLYYKSKQHEFPLQEQEMQLAREVLAVLEIVEEASERLSRADITLKAVECALQVSCILY